MKRNKTSVKREARLRRNAKVFLLEDNRSEFLDAIREIGWDEMDYPTKYDIIVVSPTGNEVELYNGELLVVYEDGKGVFDYGEPFDQPDFNNRFVFS